MPACSESSEIPSNLLREGNGANGKAGFLFHGDIPKGMQRLEENHQERVLPRHPGCVGKHARVVFSGGGVAGG